MKNIIIFFTAALLSLISASYVHAQTSTAVSVSPVIFNVTLSPGTVNRYELKIKKTKYPPENKQLPYTTN